MKCPNCGNELNDDNYCSCCCEYFGDDSQDLGFDDEIDFDSRINDGSEICLNCAYWSVSPYGASHGMICRRGYPTDGPGDSCDDFAPESSFGNYGDEGQLQFDETDRAISNKLYHWRNGK